MYRSLSFSSTLTLQRAKKLSQLYLTLTLFKELIEGVWKMGFLEKGNE